MRSQYRLNSSLIFWWKKKHFKKPKSEGSVKNFVFPIHFKQATSAVSRLPVTMLASAILSFKDMSH